MTPILLCLLPVLFAITLHEVAHGYAAELLGDDTARRRGRLSLNPFQHLDPIGSLLVPGLLLIAQLGVVVGWARPSPVDARRLCHPLRDLALVALAGPAANLLMACSWLCVQHATALPGLCFMAQAGVTVNVGMAALNLLPVAPFDGWHVARWISAYTRQRKGVDA